MFTRLLLCCPDYLQIQYFLALASPLQRLQVTLAPQPLLSSMSHICAHCLSQRAESLHCKKHHQAQLESLPSMQMALGSVPNTV